MPGLVSPPWLLPVTAVRPRPHASQGDQYLHRACQAAVKEVGDGIWLVSSMKADLDTSIWSRAACKPSTTRSARGSRPVLVTRFYPVSRVGQCRKWQRGPVLAKTHTGKNYQV